MRAIRAGAAHQREHPGHQESGASNSVRSSSVGLMHGDKAHQSEPPPVCMTAPGWQTAPLLMS